MATQAVEQEVAADEARLEWSLAAELRVLRTPRGPLANETMKRHTPNSIAGAVLLLGCGAALIAITRSWGIGSDMMSQLAGLLGPLGVVLGVGMAVHGTAMPLDRITMLTRLWGIAGSLAAVLNLWIAGYFSRGGMAGRTVRWAMPIALVVAWLLPNRFYGNSDHLPEDAARDEHH